MLHHQARQATRQAGFSLAELMAVVAVMGLVATVVAVNFMATLPRARLNSTIHDLAAAVGGARSDAIARNGEFRIYYDLDANSYQIKSPFQFGGGLAQREEERIVVKRVVLHDTISIARVTIDGLEYTEGEVFVSFNPLGSATGHTLNLVQAPIETVTTVEVLPLTGLVRFHYEEYQREVVTEEDFD
ncbi:MAG: prepilin-type N-terminal cleavage/methylation domain-containing protein [Candidatus Paceibacteria bacterium]